MYEKSITACQIEQNAKDLWPMRLGCTDHMNGLLSFSVTVKIKKNLALYVPRLIQTALQSPKNSIYKKQNLEIYRFSSSSPKFFFGSRALKLEGSSFGIRPSIYVLKGCCDESLPKVPICVILGEKAFPC